MNEILIPPLKSKNYVWIVPKNTTFNLDSNTYVLEALPNPLPNTTHTFDIPFTCPCIVEPYFLYNNIWRKGYMEGIGNINSSDGYGIVASAPGNGKLYITIYSGNNQGICNNRNTSCSPPTGAIITNAETVILCKFLE